jgi:hypothetical protein
MTDGDFVKVNETGDKVLRKLRPLVNALADLELDIGSLNNMANTLEVSAVVSAWAEDYCLDKLRNEINSVKI